MRGWSPISLPCFVKAQQEHPRAKCRASLALPPCLCWPWKKCKVYKSWCEENARCSLHSQQRSPLWMHRAAFSPKAVVVASCLFRCPSIRQTKADRWGGGAYDLATNGLWPCWCHSTSSDYWVTNLSTGQKNTKDCKTMAHCPRHLADRQELQCCCLNAQFVEDPKSWNNVSLSSR